jgi:hypothetical protein
MYFVENDDWLVMSTSKENINLSNWFLDINKDIEEIKHERIYKVSLNGGFEVLGDFQKKQY